MARRSQVPRTSAGSTVYRVEWNDEHATVAEYEVISAAPNSLQLKSQAPESDPLELTGEQQLRLFATDWNAAIDLAFVEIAESVSRKKTDSLDDLRRTEQLALLLK